MRTLCLLLFFLPFIVSDCRKAVPSDDVISQCLCVPCLSCKAKWDSWLDRDSFTCVESAEALQSDFLEFEDDNEVKHDSGQSATLIIAAIAFVSLVIVGVSLRYKKRRIERQQQNAAAESTHSFL